MRKRRPLGIPSLILAVALLGGSAQAPADDYELGIEDFFYRSKQTRLNRGNVFGLEPTENLLRLSGAGRKTLGPFSARVAAYVERQSGREDRTTLTFRQAYVDYGTDSGFLLRIGKQKTAWGSGFVWNPTARLEPPRSPANPGTEQPGLDAVRLDVSPSDWASLTLVAGRAVVGLTDLPGSLARDEDARWTGALRARLLLGSTDLAMTYLAGVARPGLFGLDLGRTLGPVALHAESAAYRGSEIDPGRSGDVFVRVAFGALWSPGDSTFSVEYFFNGEGMNGPRFDAYLSGLDRNLSAAFDPALSAEARSLALAAWGAGAAIPFGPNLGLRRHYVSAAYTRREALTDLNLTLRAVSGLSDRGVILTPGVAYAPTPSLQMSLDLVLLFGPEASEYKLAPIRRAVQARLKYSF